MATRAADRARAASEAVDREVLEGAGPDGEVVGPARLMMRRYTTPASRDRGEAAMLLRPRFRSATRGTGRSMFAVPVAMGA